MSPLDAVKVMIVEDSATVREYLVGLFSSHPGFSIVATARNGQRALDLLKTIPKPGIITMDIHMPVLDGLSATRAIMEIAPVPILILSAGPESAQGTMVFKALEAGAVGAVRLPPGPGSPGHEAAEAALLEVVRLMSEVKVVRRRTGPPAHPGRRPTVAAADPDGRARHPAPAPDAVPAGWFPAAEAYLLPGAAGPSPHQVVAIGASTGGPMAVKDLLAALGSGFPLPILLVQHMAEGFLQGFAEWLQEELGMKVVLARDRMPLEPGQVHLAPDHRHMEVTRERTLRLLPPPPGDLHVPSVARLFRSVEAAYGPTAIAALLTGMGRDGAVELASLRRAGALTFAQDEASSVVHGMPGEAIRLGGASLVLTPGSIGEAIDRIASRRIAAP